MKGRYVKEKLYYLNAKFLITYNLQILHVLIFFVKENLN